MESFQVSDHFYLKNKIKIKGNKGFIPVSDMFNIFLVELLYHNSSLKPVSRTQSPSWNCKVSLFLMFVANRYKCLKQSDKQKLSG